MAPLEEKMEPIRQLHQGNNNNNDDELINGSPRAHKRITTWQSADIERDAEQETVKQMVKQHELAASALRDESRKLSGRRHAKNYGACEQTAVESSKIGLSKSMRLDDQLERKDIAAFSSFDASSDKKAHRKQARLSQLGRRSLSSGGSISEDGSSADDSAQKLSLLERAAKVIPGLGIILALCASFSLGTAGMLVKMTHSVHGIQVAIFRSLIQLVIYTFIIICRRLTFWPERGELFPVFGRALLGASSMCFTYYALNLIPLGDATAIRFSLPIWTLIVSYFFLGESCKFNKVIAVFIAVLGVVLIAKPDDCIYLLHMILRALGLESNKEFNLHKHEHEEAKEHELEEIIQLEENQSAKWSNQTATANMSDDSALIVSQQHHLAHTIDQQEIAARQLGGCMLALASSILLSLSLIALRLAKKTPAEITIFWLSVLSILIGNSILIWLKEWSLPDNLWDCVYIVLNGLCGSAGQWFITSALKIEQSGVIALARTFDIEVAFLYSALLLHEDIRTTSIVGAVFVSSAVVIVVVPRWLGWEGSQTANERNDDTQAAEEVNQSQAQQKSNGNNYNTLVINNSVCSDDRSDGRHGGR